MSLLIVWETHTLAPPKEKACVCECASYTIPPKESINRLMDAGVVDGEVGDRVDGLAQWEGYMSVTCESHVSYMSVTCHTRSTNPCGVGDRVLTT